MFIIDSALQTGHSISDQHIFLHFCDDLLRFILNLERLYTFTILTKMQIFSYVYRAAFEI